MAKEKKVCTRDTPKYTSSSDEESDNDIDYSHLFKGLHRSKVDKINELMDALNEKDRLLEKQEDIIYEEHDKLVNAEKSLALEVKRNEILSSELSSCNESMSSLKSLNVDLNAKLEKVNIACSSVKHVSICNRRKDFDIDACNAHASTILKLNNDVANLNAQLKACKNKKLDLRGVRQPPGILIRRRPSHAGQENPRTPTPPIHSGIEAHVRTTATGAEP
jgi:chromosome segregation ATPase